MGDPCALCERRGGGVPEEDIEAMKRVKKLLDKVGYTFLATVRGQKPEVRPMATMMTADGRVVCATYPSRKTREIGVNPNVQICVMDPATRDHARISARAKVVADDKNRRALWRTITRKIPDLKKYYEGADDPTLVFIVAKVGRVEFMDYKLAEYEVVKK